jgi:hypothetical protein
MQSSGDYIPTNDVEFDKWANNFITYVKSKTIDFKEPEWPDIPYEHVNELVEAYDEWRVAYERTLVPHTPGATAAKNDTKEKLKKLFREFVKRYIHFSPRTKEHRADLFVPEHDNTRTPHIEVTELVEFEIDLHGIRELKVDFWVKNSTSKAKPQGYDGAVIIWQILNKAPASIDELTHHVMASRSSHILKFTEAERGKAVYIALAWQNARGNLGSWSEIQHAFIP